jgi:hypothetical protein
LFLGLGIVDWVTIIALVGSIPLTLMVMARASAAYERKAAERAAKGEAHGAEDVNEERVKGD